MSFSSDDQEYLYDFLADGENFFTESEFHMERTIGSKASAIVDDTNPNEGDFIDYCDETHIRFKPMNTQVMYAPTDQNIIKQVIGRKGCGFIKITEDSMVDFIWHNRKTNTIHITGEYHNCMGAMHMISKRIAYYIRKMRREKKFVKTNRHDHPCPLFN